MARQYRSSILSSRDMFRIETKRFRTVNSGLETVQQ